jgi:hypothetical protein
LPQLQYWSAAARSGAAAPPKKEQWAPGGWHWCLPGSALLGSGARLATAPFTGWLIRQTPRSLLEKGYSRALTALRRHDAMARRDEVARLQRL